MTVILMTKTELDVDDLTLLMFRRITIKYAQNTLMCTLYFHDLKRNVINPFVRLNIYVRQKIENTKPVTIIVVLVAILVDEPANEVYS